MTANASIETNDMKRGCGLIWCLFKLRDPKQQRMSAEVIRTLRTRLGAAHLTSVLNVILTHALGLFETAAVLHTIFRK